MPFERVWDASCPKVWSKWETNGHEWVVQDLEVGDFENVVNILLEEMYSDEVLCSLSNLREDADSVVGLKKFWAACLAQRMSLGLYTWVNGVKTLAAVNVCVASAAGENFPDIEVEGAAWKNVYLAVEYIENKQDPHQYTGLDTMLHAFGLLVKRQFRGSKLGERLLSAREPLCRFNGIKGTATVFTGPASQKVATLAGFQEICEATLKELAESGLKYPSDENRSIKLMIKLYE
ncbi:uncharacterized protein LOC126979464 isoform X2 [Leptidea sinapis]|uniref:N-acetyltransferase domain-containing protein n=2 Tax=Leptidea sinapis TaxID=189913 RepID=A0A5E4PU70_9NEOP|nr:uncharacterized protein LOC126979464 isoform X2 [Leptidea sinapis]VVC88451.1 unnamed protein product [Leptidea sinapis]